MRRIVGIVGVMLLAIGLTACGGASSSPSESPTSEADVTEEPIATPQFETITVFTINTSSMTLQPAKVKKNQDDDSPKYIVDLVCDNLEDDSIGISSVEQEGDNAVVVFKADMKPIKDCDEDMEYLILDCFANSILDNVEGCHGVIFRSDIGSYKSDNGVSFGKDEVYASK